MKRIITVVCIIALAGCYNDKEDQLYPKPGNGGTGGGCDTTNVTYAGTIQPILNQYCTSAGCHDATGLGGGYNMTSYEGAKLAAPRMIGAITWQSGYSFMPKGLPKLGDCEISKITKWVNMGAPNN